MNDLQMLLRSRSLTLVLNRGRRQRAQPVASFRWNGRPVFYRPGSSDIGNIRKLLLAGEAEAEYETPQALAPEVVLDIGANTGLAALRFANLYPQARIYAFEPEPENFALLQRNVKAYPNITALPIALSRTDGPLYLGGGTDGDFVSFQTLSSKRPNSNQLEVSGRNPATLLTELGIRRVDLIKIDVEGAEYDVLTALPPELLRQTSWIVGETHGVMDFELLALLSRDFEVGVSKPRTSRLLKFSARNRTLFSPRPA